MELLIDGAAAFPEILRCIRGAKESVAVNMFIWRNDRIGRILAAELLEAAERGVNVAVTKDRCGVICESCEENRLSLFHRRTGLREKSQIAALRLFYNREAPKPAPDPDEAEGVALADALCRHPNVTVSAERYRYDHSKFWLFDGRALILGGINVEDKENGRDLAGRRYADYMVKLTEPERVAAFLTARERPSAAGSADTEPFFGLNLKKSAEGAPFFGMEEAYLRLIDGAREQLTVVMAYLSPLPPFEQAFLRAAERGVRVRFLIPARANFQDDLNKKTVLRLIRKSGGRISVFLYPGMNHTKLMFSEKLLSVGSCNITKMAFRRLDELNLFVPADSSADADFTEAVRHSADALFAVSAEAGEEQLRHSRIMAALESTVM